VRRVFAIKRRPADHPLIVHLASGERLDEWAREIPEGARRLVARFWPGPLTLILKRQARVPDVVTGGQDSVGLRVPNHPLARALLAAFGGGIAAPSANRYGRVSATSAAHVLAELGAEVDIILDGGPCTVGIESTIVSFVEGAPRVLRPGAITPAMLAEVLGTPVPVGTTAVRAPGTHAAHYAPATPTVLLPAAVYWVELLAQAADRQRVVALHRTRAPIGLPPNVTTLALPETPEGYARALYDTLRRADALGAARLLIEEPPPDEAWLAVRDRLTRAATGSPASAP
jgi:L-threonylcarbamoyladenylate synthase